jgi:capsular polysaccharide biosynthesis protein
MLHNRVDAELPRGIYLGGCGASNYYHWMMEILPKLQFLDNLDAAYDDYPLLVSSYARKYGSFQDALACFAGNKEVVYLEEEQIYHIDKLVYLTSPSIHPYSLLQGEQLSVEDHFFRPSIIKSLRDGLVSGLGAVPTSGNDRLFFARSGHRRNYNEEAVFEMFRKQGFRKVYMAELTLKEQIRTIQGAEMLAGPTGAEWTNLMFCKSGTKAICWMNAAWGEFSCFSNLADISNVDLQYIYYSSRAKTMAKMNSETYELHCEALLETLESCGVHVTEA